MGFLIGEVVLRGIAILTFDPGGKTGCAWGWFHPEAYDVGAAIRRARARGSFGAMELSGDSISQGLTMAALYDDFVFMSHVELRLPYDDIHVVVEDFQLRQKHVDLAPVEVNSAFESELVGRSSVRPVVEREKLKNTDHVHKVHVCVKPDLYVTPSRQTPATAMRYATNKRLREWGAWVVGSEHARDAVRHLCAKLSNELG